MDMIAQLSVKAKTALTTATRELDVLGHTLANIATAVLHDPVIADLMTALSQCDPYLTLYGPVSAALLLRAMLFKCSHDRSEDCAHALFYGLCGTVF